MEFALSEEQELLVDSVSKMLASACSVDELRSQASGEITFSDKINNEFIGMGLNGLLVPEDLGGSGLGILEASLISEQIGKFAAPAIWVGNSVMTPMCLSNGDNKELAEKWLPKIADGSSTSGIAINEFISKREDNGLSLDDGKISGISIFAIDAEKNPDIIITAFEDELYLIETANEKIEISNLPTIDTTRVMSEIVFHSCTAHKINGGKELIKKIIDSGRVVLSADLLGASQNMLDKAIEYSLERKQFNRIIGSFSGPLFGIFVLGMFSRKSHSIGVFIGALAGLITSIYVAFFSEFSWVWPPPLGILATLIVGYLASLIVPKKAVEKPPLTFKEVMKLPESD